ncbi:MAG: TldD/PmbA family protein [Halanaerobiales bacterium]
MRKKLKDLFQIEGLDYGDVRYEQNRESNITFEGNELKEIKSSYKEGGHLRLYNQGTKALSSFSELDEAGRTRDVLLDTGRKVAAIQQEKNRLKEAPVIQDQVKKEPDNDPREYSLEEKKDLVQKYNDLVLKQDNIINSRFGYRDFYSHRFFVNSEGTEVEYELLGSYISGLIFARKGDVVQTKRISFGGYPEFSELVGREDEVLKAVEIVQQMLDAEPIKAGSYPVIINPKLAAVFIHEAFGHLSEADGIENNPAFRNKLQIGEKMGREILTVIDDPTISGIPGHYKYDDEGQRGQRTVLIDKGKLNGRLHSRETAVDFDEPLSGNMRAVDCYFTPIIRMSNIFIDKGDSTPEELFESIEDGYYLCNGKGGQTTGDQFTFGAEYGYHIKNGEKQEMVRDINISGELFSTLKRIEMIADDLTFNEVGGCGKGNPMQLNMFSGMGAPHIKIEKVNIGGK